MARTVPNNRDDQERYGMKSAFDYLVGEKLLDFARAAEREPNSRDSYRGSSPR